MTAALGHYYTHQQVEGPEVTTCPRLTNYQEPEMVAQAPAGLP